MCASLPGGVQMNKRISALKFALENEQNERDFYLANARRTKNLAGKNMFKQIADEEKEHYDIKTEMARYNSPESKEIGFRQYFKIDVGKKGRPD